MKIDPQTGFPALEFNDTEESLDRIEEAWADCAAGFRPDAIYRQTRRNGRHSIRCQGLIAVHELLENHRRDHESGERSAVYDALKQCLEENLPLPYWAADGLLRAMQRVNDEPGLSLHVALGLDSRYPLTKKKAFTSRRDWKVAVELWGLVRVHQKEHGSSLDAAIRAVRESRPDIAVKVCKRKAHELFHMVDRIQSPAIAAIKRSR